MKCPHCQFDNPDDSKFCKECGTQLIPAEGIAVFPTKTLQIPVKELKIGTFFADRYQILEELGKGGMGRVYKALDREINEEVAVKLLKPEIAADESTIDRFRNELKFARKVSHKNVCRMFHLSKEEETPYITMEYVEGENLKSLVRRKEKLTEDEAVKIAKQVCEGLAEAHRLGVIHRDLKPQNVMIDKEGQAKIMDFGIARSVEAPGITATGMMIGTPDYISPEQAEGEEADERSDIYSLGVILYEMVTGGVPFKGDTAFSVALKHKSQLPQDPRKINPELSEDFSRLILLCMDKDRKRRYQTAENLLADLRNIEEGLPLGTKMRPRRETFMAALIKKKLFIPAMVVALAITAVVIWQFLSQKDAVLAPKIDNSIAVISFENQTGDKSYDYFQKAIPNLLITNLENTGYFYVATWERMRDLLKQIRKEDVEFIDPDLGFELCRREGIDAIVLGSFIKAGDMFATDVKVLSVESKRLLKSASSKGLGEDSILATQIDELSKEISHGMGIDRKKIEAAKLQIAEYTTTSMEAYKYFLEGVEYIKNAHFENAVQTFEKAVEVDPTFGRAYEMLSWSYNYIGDTNSSVEAIKQAKAYSERATEKERLFIEASYAMLLEKDREKSFRKWKEISEKFPKEERPHIQLGHYYRSKNHYSKAIEEYNKVSELDPTNGLPIGLIGYTYADMKDYDKAIEYLKRYASLLPGDANPLDSMAEVYLRMGKFDEAIAKYKEALEVDPDFVWPYWTVGYVYALKEDYAETMKWTDQFIAMASLPRIKGNGYFWKGFYHYWLGSFKQCLSDLRRAKEIAETIGNDSLMANVGWMKGWIYYDRGELESCRSTFKSWFDTIIEIDPEFTSVYTADYSFYLGIVELKEGRINSAQSRLSEMKSLLPEIAEIAPRNKYTSLYYDLLSGEVLLAEGFIEKATAVFEKMSPIEMPGLGELLLDLKGLSYHMPFLNEVTARAFQKKGEVDKAITEYERLITFDPNSPERRLIHPKYHYSLAELYEHKGWEGKAIEHYEKFLDLWKDADPGIAEVEDAKKRLAVLKSQ